MCIYIYRQRIIDSMDNIENMYDIGKIDNMDNI